MAKVTLTIEGEPEEIRSALTVLLDQALADAPVESQQQEPVVVGSESSETPWTETDVLLWWESLKSGGQEILAEIATRPDGYPASELIGSGGFDMKGFGGKIGTSTHTMNRHFKKNGKFTKPQPWTFNGPLRQYMMHPDVAAVVQRLSEGSRSQPARGRPEAE